MGLIVMPRKAKAKIDVDKMVEDIISDSDELVAPEIEEYEGKSIDKQFKLEDLDGVGRVTAQKLRNAGYQTIRDIAYASAHELAMVIGSEDRAFSIIRSAQRLLGEGEEFITAKELFERRKNLEYISTGVRALDDLLDGGVEVGSITEFIGEFGAGKTQVCHQLAVMVQLPRGQGGLAARALYIDTEGTFRPERIVQIARHRGLDPEKTLENIIYARAYNSDHLISLLQHSINVGLLKEIGLIIIDELTNLPRKEFLSSSERAEIYHKIVKSLKVLSRLGVAIVSTRQVVQLKNKLIPAGGPAFDSYAEKSVFLSRRGEMREAERIDGEKIGQSVVFNISEEGVLDVY
ncbi:MAG: DNA repair and recombination protein RadA [Thermoprotei archaeon]|nr:MAG: DNA repair and recombination protein RadA [Thermoprotei archaeon]